MNAAVATEVIKSALVDFAYKYDPENGFLLSSGGRSDTYLDCRQALSLAKSAAALGHVFLPHLVEGVRAIGGLTLGADPLAYGTAAASAGTDHEVNWFSVRKQPKGHGRKRLVEGNVEPGWPVAVVDDVVTKGSSTIDALNKVREQGLNPVQVLVLVDRQEGGMDRILAEVGDLPVKAIFTRAEIHAAWLLKHG